MLKCRRIEEKALSHETNVCFPFDNIKAPTHIHSLTFKKETALECTEVEFQSN